MFKSQFQGTDRLSRYIILAIGILLLIYTFVRASLLSITHDEALIYLKSLDASLWGIFNYKVLPQDHMINTLLIKLSMMLFPDTPFFLRLPNLLGHVIYIVASYFIAIRFTDRKMSVIAFILLNLNPYLLDFFSIARGYGLSTSFTLVSIYFTILFARTERTKHLLLSYVFAVAAVLTVFSLLIYFVALLGWTGIYLINNWIALRKEIFKSKKTGYVLLIALVSTGILFVKLHEALALTADAHFIHREQWGNFYSNTIRSVLYNTTYSQYPYTGVNILSVVYGIFFLAAVVRVIGGFISRKGDIIKSPLFIIIILFIGSAAGIMFLHHFRGIVYPTHRTSTFIFPMLILPIGFLFYENMKPMAVKYGFLTFSALLAVSMF
ncbi:MAG: ArnT family glycosyltransferase, partial [Bacteroidales bacterium]